MYIKKALAITSLGMLLMSCGGSDSTPTDGSTDNTTGGQTDTGSPTDTGGQTGTGGQTDTGGETGTGGQTGTGGSSGTGGTSGSVKFGIINIDQSDEGIEIFGSFTNNVNSAGLTSEADLQERFNEAADTCDTDDIDDDDDSLIDIDFQANNISAGETISISSSAGTYATLIRNNLLGFTIYNPQSTPAMPLPQNLIVNIPGDEFPAFSNVSMPNVPALSITPTSSQTVNANTTFQWNANSGSIAFINIEAGFQLPSGEILDVDCVARDDGNFSFPENVRSRIGNAEALFVDYYRSSFKVVDQGNDILWLQNTWESSSDF